MHSGPCSGRRRVAVVHTPPDGETSNFRPRNPGPGSAHLHPYISTCTICTRSEELQPTHTPVLSLCECPPCRYLCLCTIDQQHLTSAAEDDLFSVTADAHRSSINNASTKRLWLPLRDRPTDPRCITSVASLRYHTAAEEREFKGSEDPSAPPLQPAMDDFKPELLRALLDWVSRAPSPAAFGIGLTCAY